MYEEIEYTFHSSPLLYPVCRKSYLSVGKYQLNCITLCCAFIELLIIYVGKYVG